MTRHDAPLSRAGALFPGFRRWEPALELILATIAGGLWYTQGGWTTYAGPWPGPLPMVLLAVMVILRWARSLRTPRGRPHLLATSLLLPLGLFLLSAVLSTFIAYDPGPARAKLWLIVGSMGFYWATVSQSERMQLHGALLFWGGLGGAIAIFFLITNDWTTYPTQVQSFTRLLEPFASMLPSAIASQTLNPNVAAGIMVMVLPFFVPVIRQLLPARWHNAVASAAGARPTRRWRWMWVGLPTVALGAVLLGCLMARSRGAWLALGLTGSLWGIWRLSGRLSWHVRLVLMTFVVASAVLLLWAAGQALYSSSSGGLVVGLREALANRLMLAQEGGLLARDTFFTGIGLGMFEMHFSIYTLLIHVGFVEHSHNVLVDLAIEQGLLGVAAYGAMVMTAMVVGVRELGRLDGNSGGPGRTMEAGSCSSLARETPSNLCSGQTISDCRLLVESALASLVAVFIHGLVDDPFYGSRAVLFLFVPFGVLVAALHVSRDTRASTASMRQERLGSHLVPALSILALSILLVVIRVGLRGGTSHMGPRLLACWYANLGAVAEARVELTMYDQYHFSDPTMDQVRRQADLGDALASFRRALTLDVTNVTANQRMAAICLARGQYADALQLAQNLWSAGYHDRVTRLLYGDALVANGRIDEAVEVTRGISFARSRLLGEAWSRYHGDGDVQREAWANLAADRLSD